MTKDIIEQMRALEISAASGWMIRAENAIDILNSYAPRIDAGLMLLEMVEKQAVIIGGVNILNNTDEGIYYVRAFPEGFTRVSGTLLDCIKFIHDQTKENGNDN